VTHKLQARLRAFRHSRLHTARHPDLAVAMQARYERAEAMLASQDAIEGPAAFAQKRLPVWRGR
jgi:enoyl-CoA hydratase/carnithine racemase